MRKKKCRNCHRMFTVSGGKGTSRDRKFCSPWCYQISLRKFKKTESWGLNRRKQLAATGIHGNEQIRNYASILNSTKAPEVEKETFIMDLILETWISRDEIISHRKELLKTTAGRQALRIARKALAKNAGFKPPQGIKYWCPECESHFVDSRGKLCQSCREKKYTTETKPPAEVPDIADEYVVGDISRDDLRRKDQSQDL